MPRIVVVEDNPDNRFLLQVLLEDTHELELFESGPEALAAMAMRVPQLVLLDISLPGMDGPEILDRIRRDPRLTAVPVVALTAHAMAGDREKYLGMGFDAYMSKPITDEEQLQALITRLLSRAAA
ncbi:MAG: response regulator [Gemmatimonadota bacterium]